MKKNTSDILHNFGKVLVLMGGVSQEREISLLSGKNVFESLKRQKIDVSSIDVIADNALAFLSKGSFDLAFVALHGGSGEDGRIQSILDFLKIPYPTSGVIASALTMNKYYCNLLCKSFGFPILPSIKVQKNISLNEQIEKNNLNLPLCVKPISSGSSFGVYKVTDYDMLFEVCAENKKNNFDVMIEKWIDGKEFTVGILNDEPLPVIEIVPPKDKFYDYEAKYFSDETIYVPSSLSKNEEHFLQNIALDIFKFMGCRNLGRIDFMQDSLGNFWFLEINTIPGMTEHSLVPKAAKMVGIDFDELILSILQYSFKN